MNTKLIRTYGTVLDGWAILVTFALYLIAFGIVTLTAVLGIAVA